MKNSFKSVGALLAGLIVIFILSIATDMALESTGLMKLPFNDNSLLFMIFVTLYRNVFNVLGCYVAAVLAPRKPMRHAIILGSIGVVLSTLGAIVMWQEPPHWYPVSLIITALPCAWLGGKLKKEKHYLK